MSDAFADLWNSSAPSKPAAQKTLAGSGATPQVRVGSTARKAEDAFSLLSSRSSSSSSFSTRLNGPTAVSQPKAPPASKPQNGSDAFRDLLGGSMAANTGSTSRMTIAERAAQAEQQRLAALQKKQQAAKADVSTWQGLDSLARSTFTPSTQPAIIANSTLEDDDWGLASLSQAEPAEMKQPSSLADDDDGWGLGGFTGLASTSAVKTAPVDSSQSPTLWDLDDFITTGTPPSRAHSTTGHIRLDGQNDALLGQSREDEDDILGDLGKPIDALQRSSQNVRKPPGSLLLIFTSNAGNENANANPPSCA